MLSYRASSGGHDDYNICQHPHPFCFCSYSFQRTVQQRRPCAIASYASCTSCCGGGGWRLDGDDAVAVATPAPPAAAAVVAERKVAALHKMECIYDVIVSERTSAHNKKGGLGSTKYRWGSVLVLLASASLSSD